MHLKTYVPFFRDYDSMTLTNLCKVLRQKVYDKEEIVMTKGELGNEMMIILHGKVGVYFDDKMEDCVVTLGENQSFGERALQNSDKRTASVVAHKVTVCMVLSKDDFYE